MKRSGIYLMKTRAANGFTLIEVLVVIAITGMITVLLSQMLTVFLRGYDQVGRIQQEHAVDSMRLGWLRDSVSAMVASLDEEFGFEGERASFTGFTMSPLLVDDHRLTRVTWQIRNDATGHSLWYGEDGRQAVKLGTWPDDQLSFAYRGLNSGWQTDWPPQDLPAGVLPHRIKLSISGAEPRDVYAAVTVRRTGRYDYRDFL